MNAVDGYVRISETELSGLRLQHLASAVDLSIAMPEGLAEPSAEVITGYTEWEGTWMGAGVSLGWDWGLIQGAIRLLDPAEIRTNIRLTGEDGSPRSAGMSREHLALWIETLPWREVASREL
ncbi:MAG: DUF4902 domain-containing protein [Steroidobacteraceae bacterium]